ncbi:uncharacterized protein LOC120091076 isoform X2 [Benincasa hispida]|uniref:uncharacterized protein LOC120091076 isoform X2 n=1 Tax=Benincasa hispida TaxID=102211 RepID=UPI001900DCE1|nr:uncharacterized protein LOC120091076 isoform X2 [Benincasa hispida]
MAFNLLKFHSQITEAARLFFLNPQPTKNFFPLLPVPASQILQNPHFQVSFYPHATHKLRKIPFIVRSSLSSSTPPTSKDDAISQAKTCLCTTLEKPINNIRFSGRIIKKAKQPRFRVEIPVIDESAKSLTELAFEVFGDLPIKRKGSPVKIVLIWSSPSLAEAASKAFQSRSSDQIEQVDVSSVDGLDARTLSSSDVAVFLGLESSQIQTLKSVTDGFYPKPVVIFNPKWAFEEESEFGELSGFIGSFEVIYSFMGLEVQGILNKRKGVIFKCVRNGVLSGELWNVLVEEEGGELKAVSKFKARPSIAEVENVLYNLMAMNSPITKSAKFLRDLVSNVTGKKKLLYGSS